MTLDAVTLDAVTLDAVALDAVSLDGDVLTVRGGTPLRGRVQVPGDKSLSHRALVLAALASGESRVRGLSDGDDVERTAAALRSLGAEVDGGRIRGGAQLLHPPDQPLDLGNSGTSLRLLAGVVAGFPWTVELGGDASLSARPMDRVAEPLGRMGATVHGRGDRCLPPVVVRGGGLRGIDYTPPVASAQVKSCVLLAGLRARGDTVVREPVLTRRHTEELLARCGADVEEAWDAGVHVVHLRPSRLVPFELDVPGDPSQAAFWVVAATVVPESDVVVDGVYVGPGRRGFLDVLTRMGASIVEHPRSADAMPVADLVVHHAPLRATIVSGAEISGLDEVPVLAVAAAVAEGTTVFRDVGELRVKESDRLAGVANLVHAFGGTAEVVGDELTVHGGTRLTGGQVDAAGDHRMAMAAAVAGLAVGGPGPGRTVVRGWGSVRTSYPGFVAHLRQLTRPGSEGGRDMTGTGT